MYILLLRMDFFSIDIMIIIVLGRPVYIQIQYIIIIDVLYDKYRRSGNIRVQIFSCN